MPTRTDHFEGSFLRLGLKATQEWQQVLQQQQEDGRKFTFVSFGLFDKKTPSMWHFCEDFEVPKIAGVEVQAAFTTRKEPWPLR